MRTLLLALFVVAIAGCSAGDPFSDLLPPRLESGEEVTLERLRAEPASFAYFSGFDRPARVVIEDASAWERAWQTLWSRASPTPPLPEVDFSRHVVLLAAMGQRSSGGHSVFLDGIVQRDGFAEVVVRENAPGPRCGTFDALTQPVDVARMPRINQPVRFRVERGVTDCGR